MQTFGTDSEQMFHAGRFLNTKTIASVFFIIDIICIGVQGAGSAIISSTLQNSGKASTTGGNIVLIGLAVQLLFFATFSVVTAYVYHLQRTKASNKVPFLIYVALLATILLITMRNAYRVVEIAVSRAAPFESGSDFESACSLVHSIHVCLPLVAATSPSMHWAHHQQHANTR